MLKDLHTDAAYYHQLEFPGKHPGVCSWLRVLLFSRGLLIIAQHRTNSWLSATQPMAGITTILKIALRIGKYLVQTATKSDILPSTIFDPGVYLSNHGHIILGAKSIGSGTVIHNCVTIGMNLGNEGIPTIGRNVWIGPHSIIYGNINVGEGATILPNTVLTKSIPAGVAVQGNPARLIARNYDNSALRSTTHSGIEAHEINSNATQE